MMNDSTITFLAQPSIISGKGAAEHLAADLSGRDIENPLILYADDREGKQLLASLRRSLPSTHTQQQNRNSSFGASLPLLLRNDGHSYYAENRAPDNLQEQLQRICSAVKEKNCGGLIVLGGGIIQSLAKLAKIITAADIHPDQFRQRLPELLSHSRTEKQPWNPIPHYALFTDCQDGYEAASMAVLPGFRCADPCLAPDVIIMDDAFFTAKRSTLQTALIALTALIESLQKSRRNIFIEYMCCAAFRFVKQGTEADAVKTLSGRKAVAEAGVFASIIRGNIGFSSVSTLAETFEAAGLIGKADAAAVLLPHLINQLYSQDKAVFSSLCSFLSDSMHYAGLDIAADVTALSEDGKQKIDMLLEDISRRAAVSGTSRIAELLVTLSLHHVHEDISDEILELMHAAAAGRDVLSDSSKGDSSNVSA